MIQQFLHGEATSVAVNSHASPISFSSKGYTDIVKLTASSSGRMKVELLINNIVISVFFSCAMQYIEINSGITLSPNDLLQVRITNMDLIACNSYATLIYMDNLHVWNNQFTKDLEETIAT